MTVAVLDTGFSLGHPQLAGRFRRGIDLVDNDYDVSEELDGRDDDGDGRQDEGYGHGTFVSGMILHLAPDAEIVPIRVLDADGVGETFNVIDGIDYAVAHGADVINISFGTGDRSRALAEAVKRAEDSGVTIVASAGNTGDEAKQYPAAFNGVISVAAYDHRATQVAAFGSFGKWVDVSAPGVGIQGAVPGGQATWSGSSLAAPIVAAELALMLEVDYEEVSKHAESLVRKSTKKPAMVTAPKRVSSTSVRLWKRCSRIEIESDSPRICWVQYLSGPNVFIELRVATGMSTPALDQGARTCTT